MNSFTLKGFCCFCLSAFFISFESSAQTVKISGMVSHNKIPLQDAFVRIIDSSRTTNLITNATGRFELISQQLKSDTILAVISKQGYYTFETRIASKSPLDKLVFEMIKDSVAIMDEVKVIARNTIISANKRTYRINPKNFIANAKSATVIQTIPDLSIVNGNIKLENRKNAIIFIDGMESTLQDLDRLDAKDIDRIEVIPNPSAIFGSDESNAVVQIIIKVKPENFIKGEVETYAGVRREARGITPLLSFKTKALLFTSYFGIGTNNQKIYNDLTRKDGNDILFQESNRIVRGWQNYFNSRLKLTLNPKSSLFLGANMFGYSFRGNLNGSSNFNNTSGTFKVADTESLNKWYISGIYNFVISPRSELFVKTKYFNYRNSNENYYTENVLPAIYSSIFSNTKEFSAEVSYARKNITFRKRPFEYTIAYKNIYRQFNLQTSDFNIRQYISSAYITGSMDISKKLSLFASISGERTDNSNRNKTNGYWNFLPVFSLLNKVSDKSSLNFEYSRKITRPGSNYLNPDVIIFNPSYRLVGNSNLLPQIRNSYAFSVRRQATSITSFSFKIFQEHVNNSIVESFIRENNIILTSYENAGKADISGIYASLTSKLFKKLSVNVSGGVNYNSFSSDANSLVKENKGFSYNASLYLNTLVKEKVMLSFNGNVSTPYYSLIYNITTLPQFGFTAETSMLKKILNLRLSYTDIFSLNAVSKNNIRYQNFSQVSEIRNNNTNLTLTLIYRFGKQFNERYRNPALRTDDILIK